MDSAIFVNLPPTKLFFRCAIPSMVTMVFGALYQIADGLLWEDLSVRMRWRR